MKKTFPSLLLCRLNKKNLGKTLEKQNGFAVILKTK